MNKPAIFIFIAIIVIVSAGFLIFRSPALAPNVSVDIKQNVENYLRENISKLSPVKAVLGGTWYVVSSTIDVEKNSGTVVYEDGHIQKTKNFSYTTNEKGEVMSLTIIGPNNSNTNTSPNNSNNRVGCTEEAKQCPDGSSVGRTGPNCEFSQCPN